MQFASEPLKPPWADSQKCSDADQSGGTLHVHCNAHETQNRQQHVACDRGLQFFFQSLLKQFLAKHLISKHTLQTSILLLQLLQLLGLIQFHQTKLTLPTMETLLADPMLAAHINNVHTSLICLTQYPDLLLCTVSLTFHCRITF